MLAYPSRGKSDDTLSNLPHPVGQGPLAPLSSRGGDSLSLPSSSNTQRSWVESDVPWYHELKRKKLPREAMAPSQASRAAPTTSTTTTLTTTADITPSEYVPREDTLESDMEYLHNYQWVFDNTKAGSGGKRKATSNPLRGPLSSPASSENFTTVKSGLQLALDSEQDFEY